MPEICTPARTRNGFLTLCSAAGVLTPEQRKRCDAFSATDAPAMAAEMTAAGLLTKFQADRLLAGKTDGFNVGPYLILEPISKSAAARTFKATHRTMNRPVAVLVPAGPTDDAFAADTRAAAKLAHPNVVTLLDVNTHRNRPFVVLDYLDASTAAAALRQSGPLPTATATDVIRQAAVGLAHAHERSLAHGRLTPASLLVERAAQPVVKVQGFGLAAFDPDPDWAAYQAPEKVRTAAADVYSLGAVFHALLTGRPPVPHLPPAELSPPVAALLARMLNPTPAARPTAAEVATELAAIASPANRVSFDLPPTAAGSTAGDFLSSLANVPANPFAGLADTHDELAVADHTPLSTPRPTAPASGPLIVVTAVGLAVCAAVGLAVWAAVR